jgi:sugar fermentation stimulation protein A
MSKELHTDGYEAYVMFVIQRPDVERFQPYRDVDPDFASSLADVQNNGVEVHAVTTGFEPPHYHLQNDDLSIQID